MSLSLSLFTSLCTWQKVDTPILCPWPLEYHKSNSHWNLLVQITNKENMVSPALVRGLDETLHTIAHPVWPWSQCYEKGAWAGFLRGGSRTESAGWQLCTAGLPQGANRIMGNFSVQLMRTQCPVSASKICKRSLRFTVRGKKYQTQTPALSRYYFHVLYSSLQHNVPAQLSVFNKCSLN